MYFGFQNKYELRAITTLPFVVPSALDTRDPESEDEEDGDIAETVNAFEPSSADNNDRYKDREDMDSSFPSSRIPGSHPQDGCGRLEGLVHS